MWVRIEGGKEDCLEYRSSRVVFLMRGGFEEDAKEEEEDSSSSSNSNSNNSSLPLHLPLSTAVVGCSLLALLLLLGTCLACCCWRRRGGGTAGFRHKRFT